MAMRAVLICLHTVVVGRSGNEQGRVQEGPEAGDGLVRGQREGSRVDGASRTVVVMGYRAKGQGRVREGPEEGVGVVRGQP